MTEFGELVAEPGERELVAGTSRAGKSSYQDWTLRHTQEHRSNAMQILVDTKPRFRAETERALYPNYRRSAAYRYRSWRAGPVVPNSVIVDLYSPHPFAGLWGDKRPGEIAIMQSGEERDWRRMLILLEAFCRAQTSQRERKITVDEVLDFYGRNTFSINSKHDVFYRMARAGGERAIGLQLGAHRIKGIPPLIRTVLSRVTLFTLDDDSDMRELHNAGIFDPQSPKEDFAFKQWRKQVGGKMEGPRMCRCRYPESYLSQLAVS